MIRSWSRNGPDPWDKDTKNKNFLARTFEKKIAFLIKNRKEKEMEEKIKKATKKRRRGERKRREEERRGKRERERQRQGERQRDRERKRYRDRFNFIEIKQFVHV